MLLVALFVITVISGQLISNTEIALVTIPIAVSVVGGRRAGAARGAVLTVMRPSR